MTPERINRIESVLSHRQSSLTLILENVFDPHNIAAVMRTADAVGIGEIHVIRTELPRRKRFGRRSSSGAIKWMKVHEYENVQECIQAVREKYKYIYGTVLSDQSEELYSYDLTESIAIAFGNEADGLSQSLKELCDSHIFIPQVGMIQSLNISVACAVTIYEAYRQRKLKGMYDQPSLDSHALEQLRNEWYKKGRGV